MLASTFNRPQNPVIIDSKWEEMSFAFSIFFPSFLCFAFLKQHTGIMSSIDENIEHQPRRRKEEKHAYNHSSKPPQRVNGAELQLWAWFMVSNAVYLQSISKSDEQMKKERKTNIAYAYVNAVVSVFFFSFFLFFFFHFWCHINSVRNFRTDSACYSFCNRIINGILIYPLFKSCVHSRSVLFRSVLICYVLHKFFDLGVGFIRTIWIVRDGVRSITWLYVGILWNHSIFIVVIATNFVSFFLLYFFFFPSTNSLSSQSQRALIMCIFSTNGRSFLKPEIQKYTTNSTWCIQISLHITRSITQQ